ncbi:hypothetical protein E2562_028265 [Oryza meyeriana var. granulata]|uniref:hAT-like transposase RNase-H fold domain-containing protein n=1 Tax=Oryza meyeriana var. granulata TaxID=110450 RepID=A0A6G1E3H5_9ORYZ|nr:hypothetical protein E2562_028265 [Oryza meyeriana var. granulata]
MVLLIATVLDPSKRLFYLGWFYEKTCALLNEVDKLVAIVKVKIKHNHEIMSTNVASVSLLPYH